MDQKNFKKCHSRNLDQTDLILDFLSTLDKTKGGYSWQQELSEINKDWSRRMDNDELDGFKNQNNHSQTDFSSLKNSVTLSPSKKVTWSSKLTNVKTISPKQPSPPSLENRLNTFSNLEDDDESTDDLNIKAENGTRKIFPHQKPDHATSDQNSHQDLVRLKSLHKQHFHHGRAAQKMRLISIVPNSL